MNIYNRDYRVGQITSTPNINKIYELALLLFYVTLFIIYSMKIGQCR